MPTYKKEKKNSLEFCLERTCCTRWRKVGQKRGGTWQISWERSMYVEFVRPGSSEPYTKWVLVDWKVAGHEAVNVCVWIARSQVLDETWLLCRPTYSRRKYLYVQRSEKYTTWSKALSFYVKEYFRLDFSVIWHWWYIIPFHGNKMQKQCKNLKSWFVPASLLYTTITV